MKNRLIIDCESNGFQGDAFSIAALVVTPTNELVDQCLLRCPIEGKVEPFVAMEVLPSMQDIQETHTDRATMLEAFAAFYHHFEAACDVVAYVPYAVETRLFQELYERGLIKAFDGPIPFLDTANLLYYLQGNINQNLYLRTYPHLDAEADQLYQGKVHNPMRDCAVTAVIFNHIMHNR